MRQPVRELGPQGLLPGCAQAGQIGDQCAQQGLFAITGVRPQQAFGPRGEVVLQTATAA